MIKITSSEFQKEFGRSRARAHKETVIITHYGRNDLALISADEYKRLCEWDQQAFYPDELPKEVIEELGTVSIPEETRQFDHEYPAE